MLDWLVATAVVGCDVGESVPMYILININASKGVYGIHEPMYIDIVPNRNSRPAILLRESVREGKRIIKRTLANLSALSLQQAEAIRAVQRERRWHRLMAPLRSSARAPMGR